VSDYQRQNPDAKAVSWRYDWFEKWFLDYITGLDWQAITQEKIPIAETGVEKKLAKVQSKLDEINLKLSRFAKLAASTNTPPATIVEEMTLLETEKTKEKAVELELAKELDGLMARRASLTEASTEFKNLIAKGDTASRLRLREEIRRRITRIDVFPNGADASHLKDEPVSAPEMPAFKITFSNEAIRWVFCDSRKPEGDAAAILDSGVPPAEMELELRERAEVRYGTDKKDAAHRNNLVPVFVPKKSKRPNNALGKQSSRRGRTK
jgi:hypothetical protein